MSRSGGFLIRHGTLRSLSEPSSSESMRAELQAAQADVADAGAQRVGDRRDAEPLRRRREMTVFSAPVSTTKSCAAPSLTFARTTTLSFTRRKSTV